MHVISLGFDFSSVFLSPAYAAMTVFGQACLQDGEITILPPLKISFSLV